MEETKELQTAYKIFRAVIYVSLLLEFFEYAIDPELLDYWGGIVCDVHDRIKRWFIYLDGNLIWSKIATFVIICITCIGTRNKKHLEFDARRQVLYPLVSGVGIYNPVRLAVRLSNGHAVLHDSAEHLALHGSYHPWHYSYSCCT